MLTHAMATEGITVPMLTTHTIANKEIISQLNTSSIVTPVTNVVILQRTEHTITMSTAWLRTRLIESWQRYQQLTTSFFLPFGAGATRLGPLPGVLTTTCLGWGIGLLSPVKDAELPFFCNANTTSRSESGNVHGRLFQVPDHATPASRVLQSQLVQCRPAVWTLQLPPTHTHTHTHPVPVTGP